MVHKDKHFQLLGKKSKYMSLALLRKNTFRNIHYRTEDFIEWQRQWEKKQNKKKNADYCHPTTSKPSPRCLNWPFFCPTDGLCHSGYACDLTQRSPNGSEAKEKARIKWSCSRGRSERMENTERKSPGGSVEPRHNKEKRYRQDSLSLKTFSISRRCLSKNRKWLLLRRHFRDAKTL